MDDCCKAVRTGPASRRRPTEQACRRLWVTFDDPTAVDVAWRVAFSRNVEQGQSHWIPEGLESAWTRISGYST